MILTKAVIELKNGENKLCKKKKFQHLLFYNLSNRYILILVWCYNI